MDQLKAQLLLFADDLVLLADSETGMQDSMNKLDEYCKLWELEINAEKTKVVVFGKTRNPSAFKIGSKTIHCDTSYKYLGIIKPRCACAARAYSSLFVCLSVCL